MENKVTLDQLYNIAPANLEHFVSPVYKRRFRFLTDEEMVTRSTKIVRLIAKRKPDTVLYSDTGAWPLVYICRSLGGTGGAKWLSIKCPREAFGSYEKIILSLLTPSERGARKKLILAHSAQLNKLFFEKMPVSLQDVLASVKDISPTHKLFGSLLHGTTFYKLLLGNVVYLDEYVDSGVTLSNTMNVLKCFNPDIQLRIVAYHIFTSRRDLDKSFIEAVNTKEEGAKAFLPGAYPYENRLDISGRYYVDDGKNLQRVEISTLRKGATGPDHKNKDIQKFLGNCTLFIERSELASSHIDERQVLRYLLYLFEEGMPSAGTTSKLLWNLFDMHGPAWSPLPDTYHLDFWKAASVLRKEVVRKPKFLELKREYKKLRRPILSEVINICYKRHQAWKSKIDKIIKNKLKK